MELALNFSVIRNITQWATYNNFETKATVDINEEASKIPKAFVF